MTCMTMTMLALPPPPLPPPPPLQQEWQWHLDLSPHVRFFNSFLSILLMIFYRYGAYNNDITGTTTTTSTAWGIEFRKETTTTSICILAKCLFFIYSTNNYLQVWRVQQQQCWHYHHHLHHFKRNEDDQHLRLGPLYVLLILVLPPPLRQEWNLERRQWPASAPQPNVHFLFILLMIVY